MKILCRFALAATLVLPIQAGDITIVYQSQTKAMMSTTSGTETHHFTPRFQMTRNEATKMDTLVDFSKGATYTIDHKKKTIQLMTFDDALAALESVQSNMPKEAAGMLNAMMGDPNDVAVDDSGAETVAGRTCIKYKIRVAKLNMELSVDPKLKHPVPEGVYAKAMRARAAAFARAGAGGATWKRLYEEMSKIQGLPLKTKMSGMMGINSSLEATSVKEGPVPEATFALPGYPVEDVGKKMREELAKKK